MKVTKIHVTGKDSGALAYADVELSAITISGFTVFKNREKQEYFAAPPKRAAKDAEGNPTYIPIIRFNDSEKGKTAKEAIEKLVLAAFAEAKKKNKDDEYINIEDDF